MTYAVSFARLRRLAGNPELTCVKPRSQWASVPSGYTFSDDYDAYVHSSGASWKPSSSSDLSSADYATVPFLPMDGTAANTLAMVGMVDTGSRYGHILPANIATVQAAQWMEIDGFTYDLAEATPMPAGAAQWYAVRLTKR